MRAFTIMQPDKTKVQASSENMQIGNAGETIADACIV